jgi:hypothetical protein
LGEAPRALAAEPIRVEARPGGVVGLDTKGVERWTIAHAALIEGKKTPEEPIGPATLGTRSFYAVGADLLELDSVVGQIVRRTRFPAQIVSLAGRTTAEPALLVTISAVGLKEPAEHMVIAFRPDGPPPGRGPWGGNLLSLTLRDARGVASGYRGANAADLTPAARDEAISAFERAEAKDRTNPFLPAFRGELLVAARRLADAARAFDAAADLPAASWVDLLSVSSTLEISDAREPARRAFTRGLAGMKDAGLRPERINALITVVLMLMPPRHKMKELADAGQVERYDEVAARLLIAFPRAQGLDRASEAIALWMRAKGRSDLAKQWDEREAVARTSLFRLGDRIIAKLDPALPFLWGAWLASLAVALAAGLRAGAALRRRRIAGAVQGLRRWLPRPRIADVISFGLVLLTTLVLLALVGVWEAQLGGPVEVPQALMDDGAAAPAVERWLAGRSPSAARDRWLEYARQEARATREGGKYAGTPPDTASFQEMMETVSFGQRLTPSLTGTLVFGVDRSGQPGLIWVGLAIVVILLYLLGALVGAWLPRASAVVACLVPGGPASLAVTGGLVGALMFASGLSLAGFDRVLRDITFTEHATLVGLRFPRLQTPAPLWPYITLALCAVIHMGAAWWDRRASR